MNYEKACSILDIKEEEVTIDIIKKQYRLNALKYHPDKNRSPDSASKFQDIQGAYEFLMADLEYEHSGEEENHTKNNYKNMLFSFLKNIIQGETSNSIFQVILNKISNTCENKAIETLEKLDKTLLIKIREFIKHHKDAFHFSQSFYEKLDELLKTKIKNDECIILNPQLTDLFDNNLYKLKLEEQTYYVPLWHHELIYDNSGSDVYVKCNPILPENVTIDHKNNITVSLQYTIAEVWSQGELVFEIAGKKMHLKAEELFMKKRQIHVLEKQGISRINTVNIYDVSKKGDIILDIEIT